MPLKRTCPKCGRDVTDQDDREKNVEPAPLQRRGSRARSSRAGSTRSARRGRDRRATLRATLGFLALEPRAAGAVAAEHPWTLDEGPMAPPVAPAHPTNE